MCTPTRLFLTNMQKLVLHACELRATQKREGSAMDHGQCRAACTSKERSGGRAPHAHAHACAHVRMYAARRRGTADAAAGQGGRPGRVPNAMASAECRVLAAQTAIGTGRAPPTIAPAACNCRRRVLCHPLVDGEGHGGAGTIVAKKDEVCAPRSLQQRRRARAVAGRNARACGAGAAREERAQRGLGGQTRAGTA